MSATTNDTVDPRRLPQHSSLPTRAPKRSPETEEFWDGCAAGRFLLPRCDACGFLIWYPRLHCPECHSDAVSYIETSGFGTVYSYTVMTRAGGAFRDCVPYVFAMVELDEGPRLLTNVIGVGDTGASGPDTDATEAPFGVGTPVEVVFEPVPESTDRLFRFRPRRPGAADIDDPSPAAEVP